MSIVLDMTLDDEQIKALQDADLTTRTAKALYDNARREREREIRRIAAEGGKYREIADVAGVAYQRVAQIVTGKEPLGVQSGDHLKYACPDCGAAVGEHCEPWKPFGHAGRAQIVLEAFLAEHPELS